MDHFPNATSFKHGLIDTYRLIVDIIRYGGDSGIVTNRRQLAYRKAIKVVQESKESRDVEKLYKELMTVLTTKPCKVMKDLYKNGQTKLENKNPYHGMTIKDGKVVDDCDYAKKYNQEIKAFGNLSQLTGIGIGIGDTSVQELIKMGYKTIDDLKKVYETNKFADFRKGLHGPLKAYFEGSTREERMTREQATDWKVVIDSIIGDVKKEYPGLLFKIAGSYARPNKETIGDIDYVITIPDKDKLYMILNKILDKLSEVTKVGKDIVKLGTVDETPSKPKDKRYTTGIKMWFERSKKKVKVEIYGYAQDPQDWCFSYFARCGEVSLQKKIKFHASKKGYKLGPWALDKRGTNTPVWEFPDGKELVKKRLGKDRFESVRDIYIFLEYGKFAKN